MKHTVSVTLAIFALFVCAQVAGLWILSQDMKVEISETGERIVSYNDQWERPEVSGFSSIVYIMSALLVGTVVLLIIIKFHKRLLWKVWFFLAVWLTLSLSIGVFFSPELALAIGLLLAILKFTWPHIIIHNVTEVFLYSGIAVLLVPLLELPWAVMLLILISIYDFIAVFKSKHMVTMAKFQSSAQIFAGLSIPYALSTGHPIIGSVRPTLHLQPSDEGQASGRVEGGSEQREAREAQLAGHAPRPESHPGHDVKTAVLGGGDIAFPLLFSGVIMQDLLKTYGLSLFSAYASALFVSMCAGIALLVLLLKAKKDTFYPAMPAISAGSFVGAVIVFAAVKLL